MLRSIENYQTQTSIHISPQIPGYIILNSNEEVSELKRSFNFSEQNIIELLTQVFDNFMNFGLDGSRNAKPLLNMLVLKTELKRDEERVIDAVFQRLHQSLFICLSTLNFTDVIKNDDNSFNYGFHSLRNNSIVLKHLSTQEGIY